MRTNVRFLLAVLAILGGTNTSLGQPQPSGDPLQNLLITPEIVVQNRQTLGVNDEQIQQIHRKMETLAPQMQDVQHRGNQVMARLVRLLSAESIDDEAALNHLDQFLKIEQEQKRLHLQFLIEVRNMLTAEQRQKAVQLQQATPEDPRREQRIKAKLTMVERAVEARTQGGQPPFDVVGLMQKFPELMKNGQVRGAEQLLDRVLQMLDGDDRRVPPQLEQRVRQLERIGQQMQREGKDVSKIQDVMSKIVLLVRQGKNAEAKELVEKTLERLDEQGHGGGQPEEGSDEDQAHALPDPKSLKKLSAEVLNAQVAALEKPDVAWRQIAWKTCLLDGLRASRDQNKPIMLWVFIDRPIDDERC